MNRSRRPAPFLALIALLSIEAVLLSAATVYLVVEILVARPDSFASAIALTALTALAAVWLLVIARNAFAGFAWTRSAAIVWQVLQVAIAVGSFQGIGTRPDVGWALLVPAVVVLILLFLPSVRASMARRPDDR